MRTRSIRRAMAAVVATLAFLAAASVAFAGGWAQVTAQNVPVDPPAGEEISITLKMLQHGQTPVSWPGLTVVATEKSSGAVVGAQAKASGPEGTYVVKLTLPTAGQWTLSYTSQDLMMEGTATIRASAPAAAPANTTPQTQATQTTDVMLPLLAVLAIFAVLAGGVLLLRRGTAAGSRVSAGT